MIRTSDNLTPRRALAAAVAFVLVASAAVAAYLLSVDVGDQKAASVPEELVASAVAKASQRVDAEPQNPAALVDLGWAYQTARRLGPARTAYERALALDGDHLAAMLNLGILEAEQGRADAARAWFEKVLAANPGQTLARFNLGVIASRQGSYDEAVKHLREAVASDPASGDSWYALGRAQEGAGSARGAVIAYRRALELLPEHAAAKEALERLDADKDVR